MSEVDEQILQLEQDRPAMTEGQRIVAARELGLTATRYLQRLNRLIDDPAAVEAYPMLTARLRRVRAARARR